MASWFCVRQWLLHSSINAAANRRPRLIILMLGVCFAVEGLLMLSIDAKQRQDQRDQTTGANHRKFISTFCTIISCRYELDQDHDEFVNFQWDVKYPLRMYNNSTGEEKKDEIQHILFTKHSVTSKITEQFPQDQIQRIITHYTNQKKKLLCFYAKYDPLVVLWRVPEVKAAAGNLMVLGGNLMALGLFLLLIFFLLWLNVLVVALLEWFGLIRSEEAEGRNSNNNREAIPPQQRIIDFTRFMCEYNPVPLEGSDFLLVADTSCAICMNDFQVNESIVVKKKKNCFFGFSNV